MIKLTEITEADVGKFVTCTIAGTTGVEGQIVSYPYSEGCYGIANSIRLGEYNNDEKIPFLYLWYVKEGKKKHLRLNLVSNIVVTTGKVVSHIPFL